MSAIENLQQQLDRADEDFILIRTCLSMNDLDGAYRVLRSRKICTKPLEGDAVKKMSGLELEKYFQKSATTNRRMYFGSLMEGGEWPELRCRNAADHFMSGYIKGRFDQIVGEEK